MLEMISAIEAVKEFERMERQKLEQKTHANIGKTQVPVQHKQVSIEVKPESIEEKMKTLQTTINQGRKRVPRRTRERNPLRGQFQFSFIKKVPDSN